MEVAGQRWELGCVGAGSWGGMQRESHVPIGERVGRPEKAWSGMMKEN